MSTNKKISEFNEITTLDNTAQIPVVIGSPEQNAKINPKNLAKSLGIDDIKENYALKTELGDKITISEDGTVKKDGVEVNPKTTTDMVVDGETTLDKKLENNEFKIKQLQKGRKNLFLTEPLKNTGLSYYSDPEIQDTIVFGEDSICYIAPIDNDTTYTVTKYEGGDRFRVGLLMEYPTEENMPLAVAKTFFLSFTQEKLGNRESVTFKNNIDANYVILFTNFNTYEIPNAQLEVGNVSSDYEVPAITKDTVNSMVLKKFEPISIKVDKLYNNRDKLFTDSKNIALKNYLIEGIMMSTYTDPSFDRITASEKGYTMVIPIDNDTTYTVTKYEGGNRFNVGLLMEYPTEENIPLVIHNTKKLSNSADKQTTTITNTIGANYLSIFIANNADSIPDVQVEKGEFETDYEEPIIPKSISIDDISNIEESIPEITQFFGFSENKVISQKAITEKFDEIGQSHNNIFGVFRDDLAHYYYSDISSSYIGIKIDESITYTYVFEIENGKKYKVFKGFGGNRFRVSLFDDLPINKDDKIYVNQQFRGNEDNTEQTCVITNTSNSRYMMVMISFNIDENPSVEVVLIKPPLTFNDYEYSTDEAMIRFMDAVNEKARDIGMINSNFVNPYGGSKYGYNTTTARDLFKMMVHGCSYEKLCNIWSKRKATHKVIGENARETEIESAMLLQIEAEYLSMNGVVNPYWILGCKSGAWSSGEYRTFANCVLVEINEILIVIVVQTSDSDGTTGMILRVQGVVEMIGIVQAILDDTYTDDMQVTTVQKAIAGIVPKMPQSYKEYEDFEILYELNADVQFNPASCSKVITAMVALDTCDNLYETLKIRGDEIVNDSPYYAQEGDVETVQSSLYASLLTSNGANTLAIARHCGGKMLYEEQKLL